jgi:hypothetical protein
MNLYAAGHAFQDLTIAAQPFDNLTPEPDATRLTFAVTARNPHYAFLLIPGDDTVTEPAVATTHYPWGSLTTLDWQGGQRDTYVFNPTRTRVTSASAAPGHPGRQDPAAEPRFSVAGQTNPVLTTNAAFALIRFEGPLVTAYLAADVSELRVGATPLVILDRPASCALSGSTISIDRSNVDFVFYGPQVTAVKYREESLAFTEANGYLTPDTGQQVTAASDEHPFSARITPNPFNPVVRVLVDVMSAMHARLTVYDVRGKRVATLWDGPLSTGSHAFEWAGRGSNGPAVSGVYFFRIEAGGTTRTLKATLVK